jgi:hypothetical protein
MQLTTFESDILARPLIGPPALDATPRPGVSDAHTLRSALEREPALPNPRHLLALALLWHDDLDGSHAVSQELEDAIGSYLHGMMHRREGDHDNAKYWFQRAGAQRWQEPLIDAARRDGAAELVTADGFAAAAFVDCCARPDARWQRLQEAEFLALARHLLG